MRNGLLDSTCTIGSPPWVGTDGTHQTYCSELNNNLVPNNEADFTFLDSVNNGLPSITFSSFPSLTSSIIPSNQYFQYRAIFESADTAGLSAYSTGVGFPCSPELKSVSVGPSHYDSSSPALLSNQCVSFYSLSSFLQTLGSGGCASGMLYILGTSNTGPLGCTGTNPLRLRQGAPPRRLTPQTSLTAILVPLVA